MGLLASLQEYRTLWVSGPPGAGKTVAIGQWLDSTELPGFWYRVDTDDQDPASFFDHLGRLAQSAFPSGPTELPYFTAEVESDLGAFSRRFFRRWFAGMPPQGTLVLDDLHEASGQQLDIILRAAVMEVPPGQRLIAISRTEPPPALARAFVSDAIGRLGWNDLRWSREETREFIARSAPDLVDRTDEVHSWTGGWIAGTVLIVSAKVGEASGLEYGSGADDAAFPYFAGEVLSRLSPEEREFLELVSVFREVSPELARSLTGSGNASASVVLERMHRDNYFTERTRTAEPRYRLHDLFHSYLRERLRGRLGESGWRDVCGRAGSLLRESGSWEEAATLFLAAGEAAGLADILLERADFLLDRGRHHTISDWVSAIPKDQLERSPPLLLQSGRALIRRDFDAGTRLLHDACEKFEAGDDLEGALKACVAIIDAFLMEWNVVESIDPWLSRLEGYLGSGRTWPSAVEADAKRTLASALLWRNPGSPTLARLIAEIENSLAHEAAPGARLTAAAVVIDYLRYSGEDGRAEALLAQIDGSGLDFDATPSAAVAWWERSASFRYRRGEYEDARRRYGRALRLARDTGLRAQEYLAELGLMLSALCEGNLSEAEDWLAQMHRVVDRSQAVLLMSLRYAELWFAIQSRDLPAARAVWDVFSKAKLVGAPLLSAFNHAAVWMMCDRGDALLALERVANWRRAAAMQSPALSFNFLAMESFARLKTGGEAELSSALRAFFGLGAEHGYTSLLTWIPSMVAELCNSALSRGIEREYVLKLISARKVPAPDHAHPDWPRTLSIRTLGEFRIIEDGRPKGFAGKIPKKPVTLLKAIIAAGRGGLPTDSAAEMLWPDLDGDAAADALNVAVYRLRALLGGKSAVKQSEGRLSLNPDAVWTDVSAFDALDSAPGDLAAGLALYVGEFLPGDPPDYGIGSARSRLAGKFVRLVETVGRDFENAGQWDQALEVYRRGIAAEPLAEGLHRGLMRGYWRLGQYTEALAAYRRLQESLELSLGIRPAAETVRLAEALRLDAFVTREQGR